MGTMRRYINRMNNEIRWASIPGFPGYEASSAGQIRNIATGNVLTPCLSSKGYLKTNLQLDGMPKHILVHRVVMAAFHGTSELQVNHKNGVKHDNRLENLEYATQSENVVHAFRQGAYTRKGEQNPSAKLDWDKVDAIRAAYKNGAAIKQLMAAYGVGHSAIYNIVTNRKWKEESRHQAAVRPTVEVEAKRVRVVTQKPGQKRKAKRVSVPNRDN
jgi:hypothetical protein